MGYLKLQLASDNDGTGELFADFESNGFRGHGSAWFALVDLAETAMQFEHYPLPNTPPVCLAGGYWNSDKPATLKEEHLHISAYPSNSRDGVGVRIRAAFETTMDGRASLHVASIELRASYEQMSHFSKALVALVREEASEVVLDERDI